MVNVFFWRDVHCGDQELFEPYKAEIQQLRTGDLHGLNFEKLRVPGPFPLYSIRTNKKTRLLLTIHRGSLCLLDVVENHDYHKSRFLRNQQLVLAYLQKQKHEAAAAAAAAELDIPNEEDVAEFKKLLTDAQAGDVQFSPLEWHKQEQILIQLNEEQESALRTPLPAIVYGSAGCGKTTLAMSMLMDYVRRNMGDAEALPVLYVSQSATLVRAMREQWRAMVSDDELFEAVCFKTYDELVDEQLNKPGFKRIEDEAAHFSNWYAHLPKQTRRKAVVELNAQDLWREFRIRSGFSEQEYIDDLGRRESALSEKNLREQVCQLYQSYKRHLEEKKLISPQLDVIEARHRYPFIMADEAQDLSYAQLVCLSKMSHDGRNVYLSGEHQVLYDGIPRVPFLKRMLSKTHQPSFVKLGGTYRCSKQVTLAVNELIKMKLEVTGGLADKDESPVLEIRSNEQSGGEFLLIHPKSPEIEALRHEAQSVRLAVVTSEVLLDEARREFGTELVFTAKGIKGLEFPTIIYWCPFDEQDKEAWSKVSAATDEQEMRLHRAKPGMGDNTYCPYWNEVITAATRAQNKLVMVQANTHHTERMMGRLQKIADLSTSAPKPPEPNEPSTEAEWEELVVTLLKSEQEKQAEAIYLNRLLHTQAEFQGFKALHVKVSAAPMMTHIAAEPVSAPSAPVKDTETTSRRRKKIAAQPASIVKTTPTPTPIAAAAAVIPSKPPHIVLRERFAKVLLEDCSEGWTDKSVGRMDNIVKGLRLLSAQDVFDFLTSTSLIDLVLENEKLADAFIRHVVNSIELVDKWPMQLEKYIEKYRKTSLVKSPSKKLLSLCTVIERLAAKEGVNKGTIQGESLAYKAAKFQCIKELEILYKFGADLNKARNGGIAPAHIIAQFGFVEALAKLHEWGVDLNQTTDLGVSPAHYAALRGHVNVLTKFHEWGVDLSCTSMDGSTPAHSAAEKGQVDVLAVFHEWGIDLNRPMSDGTTPAYLAAQDGHIDILVKFHEWGVDLNCARKNGATLPYIAAEMDQVDILVKLHEWGIDINRPSNEGIVPAFIAAQNGCIAVLVKLHEWGVDLNCSYASKDGATLAHSAVVKGQVGVLAKLHEWGIDLNRPMNDGVTPAYIAVQKGYVDVLVKLYELGVDLSYIRKDGVTLAHVAAQMGHVEVLDKLRAWGIGLDKDIETLKKPVLSGRESMGFFAEAARNERASESAPAPPRSSSCELA